MGWGGPSAESDEFCLGQWSLEWSVGCWINRSVFKRLAKGGS